MSGDGDVLDTLVKQFSDPLACLRELIQNAVDAGSEVVEVRAYRDGDHGVLEVQDHGEGMDKAVIEQKLVRLFSSSKDGDLTKIGKFGIGFVSVFALDPTVVCVDTARAGERWRVLFHRDRSWTLASLDEAMEGTRVRLYLERDAAGFARLTRDAEGAVRKWCRFLDAEVLFEGETINEPLALKGCHLTARADDGDGTVVIVGLGGDGMIGFYNKGLTLLEASTWPDLPAGVSVVLSSRWLEHTLTRDSIVKDDHYAKAITVARRLVDTELEPAARTALADATPDRRSALWSWLASRADRRLRKEAFLHDVTGRALAPRDLQASPPYVVRAGSPSADKVARAVAAAGAIVLPVNAGHADGDRDSLAALIDCPVSALVDVEDAFVAAEPVDPARAARAARLAEQTTALLDAAGARHPVIVARLMGAQCRSRLAFVVDSGFVLGEGRPTAVPTKPPPPARLGRRPTAFVVDVDHAEFVPLLELAGTQTPLAALMLARLLLPPSPAEKLNTALSVAAWALHGGADASDGGVR